jgi:DNA-binding MarR family transcriptional regulator/N-acetylglutamate synthase-like GNAT family acetyltransferase
LHEDDFISAPLAVPAQHVAALRRFNRFYTRQLGLLDEQVLGSGLSLAELRVLYELAQREAVVAAELAQALGMDTGYLSRILARFSARGWLRRARAADDARRRPLSLTAKGRRAFEPIQAATDTQAATLLAPLSHGGQQAALAAMAQVEQLLQGGAARAAACHAVTLRPHASGDMGWVVQRQSLLYAQEYGWGAAFEALVAEIVAKFLRGFDPEHEHCWIAEQGGKPVGCIFVVRKSARVAQLRLLHVEASASGQGVGARLVSECTAFARAKGYRKIVLWTNDVLVSARRLYQAEGFRLVKQEKHRTFGKPAMGQYWELML